jgi:hypothetical protein
MPAKLFAGASLALVISCAGGLPAGNYLPVPRCFPPTNTREINTFRSNWTQEGPPEVRRPIILPFCLENL